VEEAVAAEEAYGPGAVVDARPEPTPLDFESIYAAWFDPVCRWLKALGGPQSDVEDLAQEVFVVVRRKLDRFDGGNTAGWLYRIASRTVSDARRRSWFKHLFARPTRSPSAAPAPPSSWSARRRSSCSTGCWTR
jgi:DNA-directed RNA polymerase specialized sigma24 family protein